MACYTFPKPTPEAVQSLAVNHPDEKDPVWEWLGRLKKFDEKLELCKQN